MKKDNYTTQLYLSNKKYILRLSHIENFINYLHAKGLLTTGGYERLWDILNGDYDTWYDFDEVLDDLDCYERIDDYEK